MTEASEGHFSVKRLEIPFSQRQTGLWKSRVDEARRTPSNRWEWKRMLSIATPLQLTLLACSPSTHDPNGPADTLLLASATKWLAAITLLSAVEDGVLTLADSPQHHLAWWTSVPSDSRCAVTLEQRLSFPSGLTGGMDRTGDGVTLGDVPDVAALCERLAPCAGLLAGVPGGFIYCGL